MGHVVGRTICTVVSRLDKYYKCDTTALVVKKIATIASSSDKNGWKYLQNLNLADPAFFKAHKIDLLLGAAVYADILMSNVIKGSAEEPIAQQTKFGWIIFGALGDGNDLKSLCHALRSKIGNDDLATQLKSFWELEEVATIKHLTLDEQRAEEILLNSVKRDCDGHFSVDLPFKIDETSTECLGQSKFMAEKRLRSTQRRFSRLPEIKEQYDQNIAEYLTLGHMQELQNDEKPRCFLPHHPVIKASSSTTKTRTVFDASAKTGNGFSLNDRLFVGPTIQPELFDQLLQWRRFKFAISGDIEKMYRQIRVNPNHALFQCLLWQAPDSNEVKTYKLLTVTFGTASAPYQATAAVHRVGELLKNSNPELAKIIQTNFYVDDFMGTARNLDEANIYENTSIQVYGRHRKGRHSRI